MTYSAEISRKHPALMGFLVDQSGSMDDEIAGMNQSKCEATSDAINKIVSSLIAKNLSGDDIHDRFEIFILGYGGNGVVSAIEGVSVDEMPVTLSKLNESAEIQTRFQKKIKKEPDGAGGIIEKEIEAEVKFQVWMKPEASGPTPWGAAFRKAEGIIQKWIEDHRNSYPPILINITDGEGNDEDPIQHVQNITNLETDDGGSLVFNIHISDNSGNHEPAVFPDDSYVPSDNLAKKLFEMSSNLTPSMIDYAKKKESIRVTDSSRGYAYNAELVELIEFLDIGTRVER